MSASICVIRTFKRGDEYAVSEILSETTMEKMLTFYGGVIFSQALPEVSITLVGLLFIAFKVPLQYAMLGIPLSMIVLYFMVWVGFWIKQNEIQEDLRNITRTYLSDMKTTFLVAEVYAKNSSAEGARSLMPKVKKIEYEFVTGKEFEVRDFNLSGRIPKIVGCVAISKSLLSTDSAWMRRMAVTNDFRRRHIGTELLHAAEEFCKQKDYNILELKVTELYCEGNELFDREGYKTVARGELSYLFLDSNEQYHKSKFLHEPIERDSDSDAEETSSQSPLIESL